MTSSPFFTLNGAFSPLSRRLPSPTARILPRLGFSLAESGRTMPDLVLLSASRRLMRILSPRGRSLAMIVSPWGDVSSQSSVVITTFALIVGHRQQLTTDDGPLTFIPSATGFHS